jgi:hypothetical protein
MSLLRETFAFQPKAGRKPSGTRKPSTRHKLPPDERSRRNGSRSKGPATLAGRQRSSTNAMKHGLTSEKLVLLPWENPEGFAALRQGLLEEWVPRTLTETLLVDRFALTVWKQARGDLMERDLSRMQPRRPSQGNDAQLPIPLSRLPEFSLLERYQGRLDRLFFRCIATLTKLTREELQPCLDELSPDETTPDGEAADGLCRPPSPNEPSLDIHEEDQELAEDLQASGETLPSGSTGGEPSLDIAEADQALAGDLQESPAPAEGVAATSPSSGEAAFAPSIEEGETLLDETLALMDEDPEKGWARFQELDRQSQEQVLAALKEREEAFQAALLKRADEQGDRDLFLEGRALMAAATRRSHGDEQACIEALRNLKPVERLAVEHYLAILVDVEEDEPNLRPTWPQSMH